jgi:hypothetical protein
MQNYEDFLKIDCNVFHLNNINKKLFEIREKFCTGKCQNCIIHQKYNYLGLSCNEALNKYSEEVKKLMEV